MIKCFLLPPFLLTLSLLMKHNFILLIPYYRNHFTHSISSNLSNRTNKLLPMCQTSSVLQLLPLPHTYQHFTLLNHNYNYRYAVTEIILHVLYWKILCMHRRKGDEIEHAVPSPGVERHLWPPVQTDHRFGNPICRIHSPYQSEADPSHTESEDDALKSARTR